MEYFRKKFRRSRRELENFHEPEPNDRLSNLPNDIVHHILSYLDNTEVMKTSLLARKWRDIWVSVPCLNFDLREFWKQNRLSYVECVSKFWLFIKRAISIRKASTIYKVRLLCDYFDGYQLELLLFICAVRNVPELYISAGYGMQRCPLHCALPENVETITANIRYLLDLEPFTGLWNVKTLHLVGVRFPDANIVERLFGDCGVLENLSIESCCFLTIKSLKICSNKLRKLNFVNRGLGLYGRKCIFGGQLELHTPNLESFCYTGPAIRFSESSGMSLLKNVSVLLRREFLHPRVPSVHICTMVSAIHHVENLSLSAVFLLVCVYSMI